MVLQDRTYTQREYEAITAEHAERRFELIHGELVEKMPTQLHAAIVSLLTFFMMAYLRENTTGYALVEARYSLPDDPANVRIPDLSYIGRVRGPLVTQGAAPYMPDLAVEVQSPGQSDRFMADKAAFYLANGSKMVWLVYPEKRLVEVLTATDRHLLTEAGTIDGGEVLPGFSVGVKDIFPVEPAAEGAAT